MVNLGPALPAAAALSERLGARGLLCFPFGPRRLRLVTHLDVTRAQCERAVEIFRALLAAP